MVLNPFLDSSWSDTLEYHANISWQIRKAVRRDVPALAELERITFRKPWSAKQLDEEFDHPERSFFLLASASRAHKEYILAYISWWQILDQADILNVSVHPGWRRKGIARALLNQALSEMEKDDIRLVTLEVAKKKKEAQGLYLSCGFSFVGEIKGYYPEYADDALLMSKSLQE